MDNPERAGNPSPLAGVDCVRLADLSVDLRRRRVFRGTQAIALPDLSFDFLAALIRGAPEVVSIDSLMESVWPGLVVGLDTVSQRVRLLRTALGDDSKEPRYIRGVRGRGYRLVVEPVAMESADEEALNRRAAESAIAVAARAPSPNPRTSTNSSPSTRSGPRTSSLLKRYALVLVGVAVIALVVAIVYMAPRLGNGAGAAPASAASIAPAGARASASALRIAVLPFENLSPDPNDAFFTEGLHEEIISTLAERIPDAQVISRTTMASYGRKPAESAVQIAHDLNATHLVEGSVRRQGDRVRLTLQLIDARSDAHIWSNSYDRTLRDALTLQTEVAAEIGGSSRND